MHLLNHLLPTSYFRTVSRMMAEDFLVTVRSDDKTERSEAEDCLSATAEAARRDPETGIVTLTLHLVYAPLRTCR